jgi:hypothetical protein
MPATATESVMVAVPCWSTRLLRTVPVCRRCEIEHTNPPRLSVAVSHEIVMNAGGHPSSPATLSTHTGLGYRSRDSIAGSMTSSMVASFTSRP